MSQPLWPEAVPTLPRAVYAAWVVSSYLPTIQSRRSAAAWRIHPIDDSADATTAVKLSKRTISTEKRGNIAAAIGVCETLNDYSTLLLFSRDRYLIDGLSLIGYWKANRWRKVRGTPVVNADLWKRLLEISKTRNIRIIPMLWYRHQYRAIGNELRRACREAFTTTRGTRNAA